MKLIITGSIAFDYLMSFPGNFSDHFIPEKLDHISVSFLVDSLNKRHGGCAANIAYNLALLEENPLLVGSVGCDFTDYGNSLKKAGVDISHVLVVPSDFTASFFANSDQRGNQIASFYTGAMQFAGNINLDKIIGDESSLTIVSPNDPLAMSVYVKECKKLKQPFIYDPGQQVVRLNADTLIEGIRDAKLFILNDYELEMVKKKTKLTDKNLLELAEAVIVTLGESGSEIWCQNRTVQIPVAKPDRIKDPTGVGDAFRAGLMKGMVTGMDWEISGRMGSLAAAYVLETDGPQSHTFNLQQFVDRYSQTFKEIQNIRRLLSKS